MAVKVTISQKSSDTLDTEYRRCIMLHIASNLLYISYYTTNKYFISILYKTLYFRDNAAIGSRIHG